MENYKLFVRSMKVMGNKMYIYLGAIFVMSISFAMFGIMSSFLMKSVVDIAQTGEYQKLAGTIVVIVVIGVISLLIYRVATIRYNVEAKRVYGALSEAVLDVEMSLPYSYYEKHHSGEIVSKVSYDLTQMGNIYGSRLRRVVMPFLQVVAFLVPMLCLSWQLTLCLIAANAVMMGVEMTLLNPMHRVSKSLSGINTRMTSRLSDLLQGMEQVRMYESGHQTINEFKRQNHEYAKESNKKILYTACLECSGKGFELLCSLVFLVIGIFFVNKGYTTLGALTAIYTMYGAFSFQFLQMGKYIPELVGCLANAKNIFDFLDEAREPKNWYVEDVLEAANIDADMSVSIETITFSYDGNGDVLKDFSLDVKQGECIAITGASGCGKTTLSKLLLGLYPLNGGTIKVNGIDFRDCCLGDMRKQIAYVPQEPYLFNGSILDNIRMGRPQATEDEIMQAAKLANAHEFIVDFAEGYETNVGERGNNLSGGQRQRIAIARAILKDAPIILMDEATSALDNESEQLVNDALKNLHGKRTIVMIAHRPSTVQLADRVCCMG
ncbi:MAG: ABC transporter ATP-binding protein [Lachnospiraceae bacterium]|nr:ABC transporter ATP-binding protein [Lachnospiraceae bacterium]